MIHMFIGPTKRVKRIVKNVHSDRLFNYSLTWIDDETTMKELPEYKGHVIEDIVLPPQAKSRKSLKRFSLLERHRLVEKQPRGRRFIPKTGYLPLECKRGRPKAQAIIEKSHFFPNFQVFKSIISKETSKTNRLVILSSIKTQSGFIKFTCKEISTFFIGSEHLENLKNQSWTIVRKIQLIYSNWDINIDEKYVLPFHFVDRNYYSEENIGLRKAKAERTKQINRDLQEMIRIDMEEEKNFINDFDKLVEHRYNRNHETDLKMKQRLFRKLRAEGRADVLKVEPSDLLDFDKNWKKAYDDIKQKKKEVIRLLSEFSDKNHKIHNTVLGKLFTFPVTLKDVLKHDLYSAEEFDDFINNYKNTFEGIEKNIRKMALKKARLDFQKYIQSFSIINPGVNEKVKITVLSNQGKSVDKLDIDDIKLLTTYWPKFFDRHLRLEEKQRNV